MDPDTAARTRARLLARARDPRASERIAAARDLASDPDPKAAIELRRLAFHDEARDVRYHARRALDAHRSAFPRHPPAPRRMSRTPGASGPPWRTRVRQAAWPRSRG